MPLCGTNITEWEYITNKGKNPETDDRFRQLSGFFSHKLVNDENPQNIVDIVDNCVDNYGEKSGMLWNAGRKLEKPKAVQEATRGKFVLTPAAVIIDNER